MNKLMICLLSMVVLWAPVSFAKPAKPAPGKVVQQDDAAKLAEVEAAIKDLNQQISDIKTQRSELEKKLEQSETSINETMKRVEDIKKEVKKTESQAGALAAEKKN